MDEFWGPTRFEIGQPWPWEAAWVAERGFYWLPESSILLMVEEDVTPEMCEAIAGPADFALLAHGPLVGLLARFGDVWGWAETFVWRRPGQGIPEPLIDDGSVSPHLLLRVVLVDQTTKEVCHMRACTVSAHFTRTLYAEVANRWATGTTPEGADAAFTTWAALYPTIDDALKGAVARSHGGD